MSRINKDSISAMNAQLDKLTPEELDALAREGRRMMRDPDRQREYLKRHYARKALAGKQAQG